MSEWSVMTEQRVTHWALRADDCCVFLQIATYSLFIFYFNINVLIRQSASSPRIQMAIEYQLLRFILKISLRFFSQEFVLETVGTEYGI